MRTFLAPIALAAAALAVSLATAPRAASQQVPDSDLAAAWWVETRGPDVIGKLTFAQDAEIAGTFGVSGKLMLRIPVRVARKEGCRAIGLFEVAEDQQLAFSPRGQLRGTLALTSADEGEDCTATLRIVRGKDRVAFRRKTDGSLDTNNPVTRLSLRGVLTIGETRLRRALPLRGVDLANVVNKARWTGASPDTHLRGHRIFSDKFGTSLAADDFPFLSLRASGAARIDGVRREGVVLTGTIAVARHRMGLVQINETSPTPVDLGSGGGLSRHFISNVSAPLISVRTRMTPSSGPSRRVEISGQLE